MDNSDDYFQDSLDLDENDLALLAAEEAKFAESISQIPARIPDSLPPQKRQKTSHRHMSEDILDVFLQPDGTYGVAAVMRQDEEGDVPVPKNLFAAGSQTTTARPIQANALPDAHSSQSLRRQSSLRTSNARTSHTQSGRTVTPKVLHMPPKPTTTQHLQPLSKEPPLLTSFRKDIQVDTARNAQSEPQYEEGLEALKATVEVLKLENNKVKEALQDAEVARFAREGEVTILRKKVEKAVQQHAEDLVKLRETKEAASIEQARIQKDMKEQIERLRTEYIFKQHEVESSTRKTSWSTRSRRAALGSQPSPIPLPPAMRDWTSSTAVGPSRNNLFLDTPSRRRPSAVEKSNQVSFPKIVTKPRPAVSELKFPGFENSFLPSSPLNSPSRSRQSVAAKRSTSGVRTPQKGERGKGKEVALGRGKNGVLSPAKLPALTLRPATEPVFDELPIDDSIQDFDGDVEMNDGSPRRRSKSLRVESSPNPEQGALGSVDLDFSDEVDQDTPSEECTFGGIDWREELHYMLFSHVCTVSKTLTFHFLLSVNVPNQDYQQSCSAILEVLGTKYKFATLHKLMEAVAEKFLSMAIILWESEYFRHLRALFDLLNSTMAYIPSFTPTVLQIGFDEQNPAHKLLRVFCDIALQSLDTKDSEDDDERSFSSLVHSMLALLETVAWTIPEAFCSYLMPLLQTHRVLLTLLDDKQPSSVISHTINALVLLASHPSLFQSVFSAPNEGFHKHLTKTNPSDPSRVPLLERLSGFFVDPSPLSNSKLDGDLSSILNFFALLLVANPAGRPALLKSNALIPCLIHYLTRLSTLLWEDDEQVMQSFDHAKCTIRNIKQTLHLLHRLVLPTSIVEDQDTSDFDFRQKLFYAPHTMFNGLAHMFVVMIGRLSYADPPDWLDMELQAEIEKLTEPARDLMDLIVEGPEGDSVWVAYQDAESESVTEDDDEIEARLLDADEHD